MTREEQLACLKDRPCSVCKMRADKGCISWECVFEQTPDEEKEPCDCISRAELLKAVDTWDRFGCDAGSSKLVPIKDCYVPYIHYDDVVKAIKGMPSIQPKPKTGRWISDKYGQYCNQCGNGINTPYKFCPFCGADMREYTKE